MKSLAVDAGHDADGGGCGVDDDDVRYDITVMLVMVVVKRRMKR